MCRTFPLLFALGLATALPQPARPEAPADELAKLQKLIRSTPEEDAAWAEVPWLVNMREARQKAAAEGKPLVVWTMSGEPLGMC